ncbi:unnamed protein product [Echinostoma caproni]|uniref:MSP domain-containing protein n=1 Tax=Echinostoma caproni TaxID=27848 RepID=A0A183A634_9TREM|nr:unnamed protein product [Echinostoma caproni]
MRSEEHEITSSSANGTPIATLNGGEMNYHVSPARQAAYEALRRELEQAMRNRATLRNKHIPKYFRSREGVQFLIQQGTPTAMNVVNELTCLQALDVTNAILSEDNGANASPILGDVSRTEKETMSKDSSLSDSKPPKTISEKICVERKLNVATHSTQRRTLRESMLRKHKAFLYYDENVKLGEKPHVPLDAIALAKHRRIRVPGYLYACRREHYKMTTDSCEGLTTIKPNEKQARVEDPVRRRQLFTSLIGGPEAGQLALRLTRGLRLRPCRVDCGYLRPGSVRQFIVRLINWGPETAWFRVRSPPTPESGIQVFYKPGPVPAGLSRAIRVQVQAVQPEKEQSTLDHEKHSVTLRIESPVEGAGSECEDMKTVFFGRTITLETDTHIIRLPITGRIIQN